MGRITQKGNDVLLYGEVFTVFVYKMTSAIWWTSSSKADNKE